MMGIEERIGDLEAGAKSRIAWLKELDDRTKSNSRNIAGHEQKVGQIEEDVNALRARVSQLELGRRLKDVLKYQVGDFVLRSPESKPMCVVKDYGAGDLPVASWDNAHTLILAEGYEWEFMDSDDFWAVVREGFRRLGGGMNHVHDRQGMGDVRRVRV